MIDTSTQMPVNQTASIADTMIKGLENILVPIAENAIIAAVPELGLPVVKQITEAIESALADKLTKLAETGVTFMIIDGQVISEESTLSQARATILIAAQTGDPNALQKARQDFADAQSALAHNDGSASPQ